MVQFPLGDPTSFAEAIGIESERHGPKTGETLCGVKGREAEQGKLLKGVAEGTLLICMLRW
jgi:hypothetical protein